MKRFAFHASDDDRSHFAELAFGGARVTVHADPSLGGTFMLQEDTTRPWAWLDDIDLGDAGDVDEAEEGDLCTTPTDEAIDLGAADSSSASPLQRQGNRPMSTQGPMLKAISRLSTAALRMEGFPTLA